MPGENLQKLSKPELRELRRIVRKVYGEDQGLTPEQAKQALDDRECDKLIDSLLPDTVDKLREAGIRSGFAERKKFFMPSPIVDTNGHAIMKDDC